MDEQKLRNAIRNIPDFPKPGIDFKDITPILQDPGLCAEIVDTFIFQLESNTIDVVVGVESRGFLFGMLLAARLQVPFVPIRKKGKLPFTTIAESYDLEYGSAIIEIHQDAFKPGANVLIHDDLLATGGTITASSKLVEKMGGVIVAFTFLVELQFLQGRSRLSAYSDKVISLTAY